MGNLRLYGSTSGYVEIAPPAVGGSQVLTLPTDSVQPGLVLINKADFSSVSSVSVNNCFSSTYQNYLIVFQAQHASTTDNMNFMLRLAGTNNTANYAYVYTNNDNAISTGRNTSQTAGAIGKIGNGMQDFISIDVMNPYITTNTSYRSRNYSSMNASFISDFGGFHAAATSYDGFTIATSSGGNVTGTVRIYGYRNS